MTELEKVALNVFKVNGGGDTDTGRKIRAFNVIDDHNRESLGIPC